MQTIKLTSDTIVIPIMYSTGFFYEEAMPVFFQGKVVGQLKTKVNNNMGSMYMHLEISGFHGKIQSNEKLKELRNMELLEVQMVTQATDGYTYFLGVILCTKHFRYHKEFNL